MPQHYRMAVVDSNIARAKNLILHLRHLHARRIEYFADQSECYHSLSNPLHKNRPNVIFLYTDSKNSQDNLQFVSDVMADYELSHIQIYIVTETYSEEYLIQLFRHGAIGHLHFPLSVDGVLTVLNKAKKLLNKIS